MPGATSSRIEDALSQLVEHLQPTAAADNDEEADQRYFRAFDTAKYILENAEQPAIVPDENHAADAIRRRLVQENDDPEAALQFGHLFSRLLSRPVLNQKWAILYLLNQLSNRPVRDRRNGHTSPRRDTQADHGVNGAFRGGAGRENHDEEDEDRLYDDAFSRHGLPRMPPSRAENKSPPRHPISRPHERPRRQDFIQAPSPLTSPMKSGVPVQQAVDEAGLLRDLPFTLQGVSSNNLLFSSPTVLKLPQALPAPFISLLHSLAEPSLLYKTLQTFVDSPAEGLVGQSFRAAVGTELRQYLSLVATLEGQIRRALIQISESNNTVSLGKAGVTLKRCVIWTRDATLGLRLMTGVIEESRTRKGGQLITLVHQYATAHGDPFVTAFAERLLTHVTRPFYEMLRSWIYDGELTDPYREFFVVEQDPSQITSDNQRGAATSVWEDKYHLNDSLVPTIITPDFAQRVFLIGKSLNFIRTACADPTWVQQYSKTHARELKYADTATLASSIDEAYASTMSRLIHLMTHKFHLLRHLTALKKYLLLSQGDFIALLMESLASNLDRPANSQYRHTLTAQLEHAIRGSNAQFEHPDILRRLDARMLELSMGEIGWDVFTLEYKVDAPVDVIVTPHANIQYLKIFNFLWRVKRVEFALGVTWRRVMTGARGVLKDAQSVKEGDWKQALGTLGEMNHFIRQLNYYILFSVVSSAWTKLQGVLQKDGGATLDDLIGAHAAYLKSITKKGLLSSSGQPAGSPTFATQLHELLKGMLSYREAVEGLYAVCVDEAARADEKRARIERRTARGQWGTGDADEEYTFRPRSSEQDDGLPPPLLNIGADGKIELNEDGKAAPSTVQALRDRLKSLGAEFRTKLCSLLGDLAHQPDPDLRFLGVSMNFNDVYKVTRRSRRGGSEKSKGSGATEKKDGAMSREPATVSKEQGTTGRERERRRVERGGEKRAEGAA